MTVILWGTAIFLYLLPSVISQIKKLPPVFLTCLFANNLDGSVRRTSDYAVAPIEH